MDHTDRAESSAYPYATHLNVVFGALEKIELDPLVSAVRDQWYNQTLARVNDSVVRLGVTRAPERSVILMLETAAIVPTGD